MGTLNSLAKAFTIAEKEEGTKREKKTDRQRENGKIEYTHTKIFFMPETGEDLHIN